MINHLLSTTATSLVVVALYLSNETGLGEREDSNGTLPLPTRTVEAEPFLSVAFCVLPLRRWFSY